MNTIAGEREETFRLPWHHINTANCHHGVLNGLVTSYVESCVQPRPTSLYVSLLTPCTCFELDFLYDLPVAMRPPAAKNVSIDKSRRTEIIMHRLFCSRPSIFETGETFAS